MPFDNWMTPPDVIELVREVFNGSIDFDPASNYVAQRYVKARGWCIAPDDVESLYQSAESMPFSDGLSVRWRGNVFCNPPYSAGNIDKFVDKATGEWTSDYAINSHYKMVNVYTGSEISIRAPNIEQMILLVNSATDARWYHSLLHSASVVLLWRGRIKFWKIENGEAHEKWEGQKSKERGLGKIGNSPRYLNTMFYWGRTSAQIDSFCGVFGNKGTILKRA